ncbi:MAG: sigma-70 family RNA polymerase sigma factor [Geitlerinemataceae cyanobacterium]
MSTAPLSSLTDNELYARLCNGDRQALGTIYDRHGGLVYALALKVLHRPSEAEDLTQEIFLLLWNKQKFDPQRGKLSSFLSMLTRSRAIDRLRSRKRSQTFIHRWGSVMTDRTLDTPFDSASLEERRATVRDALEQLPEKYRQILELAYYEGMSQSEIAKQLVLPLGTVKTRSRQGLLTLRKQLQTWMG